MSKKGLMDCQKKLLICGLKDKFQFLKDDNEDCKYHNLHQNSVQRCFAVLPIVISGVLCAVYNCRNH